MKKRITLKLASSIFFSTCLAFGAIEALNGIFPIGSGIRSMGMGGTATANPQDGLVVANNPAGISFIDNQVNYALQWFSPHRLYSYTGSPEIPSDHVISQRNDFFIPGFAYTNHLDCSQTFTVGAYARGGLNTTYPHDNPIYGNGKIDQVLELDYMQMVIAPTYAKAISSNHSVGISLLYGIQRLRIKGLQGLTAFSSCPHHVTNKGFSWAQGVGARIGWMGQILCNVKVGVSYATKIYMSRFHKYRGLLAQHGRLDSPAALDVGISWQITDCLLLAFDYERIYNKDVKALGHSIDRIGPGNLGTKGGAGFGWRDQSVYKVGFNYRLPTRWELRAGYNYCTLPYSSSQVDPNILAPTIVKHHVTVGATYQIDCLSQIDLMYQYGFDNHIKGLSKFGLGKVREKFWMQGFGLNFTYFF